MFRLLQERNAGTRHQLITLIMLFYEELLLIFHTRKPEANHTVSINRRANWERNNQAETAWHGTRSSSASAARWWPARPRGTVCICSAQPRSSSSACRLRCVGNGRQRRSRDAAPGLTQVHEAFAFARVARVLSANTIWVIQVMVP